MIRSPHFQQHAAQSPSAHRRPERPGRSREDMPRPHQRVHRYHDIRCQEADQEIRDAFKQFSYR